METLTLDYLKKNQDQLTVKFILQMIHDLWENYMFREQSIEFDSKYINHPTDNLVGYFREWVKVDQELDALDAYLPQSDSSLAEIIRYTEKAGVLD